MAAEIPKDRAPATAKPLYERVFGSYNGLLDGV
jgi:hypothetical protein